MAAERQLHSSRDAGHTFDHSSGGAGSPLAALPPGPELLTALLATEPADRDPVSRIDAIVACERLQAYLSARQVAELAEFARAHQSPRPGEPGFHPEAGPVEEFAADEIAAALHLSARSAQNRLYQAVELTDRLRAVRDARAAGELAFSKARLLVEETGTLDPDVARAVTARVLPRAPEQTFAQLSAALRRAVLAAIPVQADQDYVRERDRRHVSREDAGNGMAWLHVYDTADTIGAAWAYVTLAAQVGRDTDARAAKEGTGPDEPAEDTRTMDQRRADALAGLVTAGLADPGLPRAKVRAAVSVIVPVGTLLGVEDPDGAGPCPAELAGYGPIPTALALEIAADAQWTRLLTDPATGHLLEVDPTRYQPPAALARFIRVRDRTCRFPGCPVPAERCDLDHTTAHRKGGPTDHTNLGPFHRYHHRGKHEGGWQVAQPEPGTFEWTSPTGHVHTVQLEPLGPIDPRHRDRPPGEPPDSGGGPSPGRCDGPPPF